MTEFERAVLTVLARTSEPLGWYQIERMLSNMTLVERLHLVAVLDELRRRGLVEQFSAANEPKVRHQLTPAGATALS
jgi:hypothetical protein